MHNCEKNSIDAVFQDTIYNLTSNIALTWQESLPPSWKPAHIMSERMSMFWVDFIKNISWHMLESMIGTCTSCKGPAPDKATEKEIKI